MTARSHSRRTGRDKVRSRRPEPMSDTEIKKLLRTASIYVPPPVTTDAQPTADA